MVNYISISCVFVTAFTFLLGFYATDEDLKGNATSQTNATGSPINVDAG